MDWPIGKTAVICEASMRCRAVAVGLTRSTALAARGTMRATIIIKIKLNNPQINKR
uniref:Uncharacterized protein n=1 Tax=blood disease bacterium R229 TaxID=741978 RepID=G2ZUY4_9RALS|nr:hypothetical protein BDB_mp60044 [blood disease bacterium R229]